MDKKEKPKCCPCCGSFEVDVKQRITGFGAYRVNLKTKKTDFSSINDGLDYKNTGKYAYCSDCGARVIRIEDLEIDD